MNKIDFDNISLSNKNDIYKICSDPLDAEAIFQFLVTGNKVLGDAPDIYFFIDAVTYIVFDECVFLGHGIIDISKLSNGRKILFYLRANLLDILSNLLPLNKKVVEMKLTGSFKIKPRFDYEKNPNIFRIVTSECSYVADMKIPEGSSFTILREYLGKDETTGELFPLSSHSYKDVEGVKQNSFFFNSIIDSHIEHYYGGYDGIRFIKTEKSTIYSKGLKSEEGSKNNKERDEQPKFEITSEDTYQTIITALTKVISNPEKPFLKDDKAIAKHFKIYFPKVTGLSKSTLTKILAKGKPILKERETARNLNEEYLTRFKNKKKEFNKK